MTKLVIFDLDGTLLDTLEDLAISTNHALAQNGFPQHDTEAYRFFVGNGITKLMERARLIKSDVLTGLAQLSAEQETFDIIFMDPPYAAGLAEPTLEKIVSGGLLAQEGMVIVERSAQIPLAPIKGLYVDREKNYKTTVITFLRPEESAT